MKTNTFAPTYQYTNKENFTNPFPPGAAIVVVGAGAFGGWSALWLLRRGFKVTLIDAWGPGNSRSSSGDETRVIRSTYGANELYFDLNVRALELWKQHQENWNRPVFKNAGVLWFCYQPSTPIVDDSIPFSKKHKMEYEFLTKQELVKKYPLVNSEDLDHGWLDPHGGFLKARESCSLVVDTFIKEGGTYQQTHVQTPVTLLEKGKTLKLADGSILNADGFLFACGSWLGQLFPEILGNIITCTRQEVFYFGLPSGSSDQIQNLPVWIDVDGQDYYYGIPFNDHRGFKVGVDRRGKSFDPTLDDRFPNSEVLDHARQFLSRRFPALKNAPLIESRVCPYENSPDGNFVFDQHPEYNNIWFLGGGSGHGFKHGPALGEWVAETFQNGKAVPSLWRIKNKV